MSETPLYKLVEELPSSSLTTRCLGALDYLVPGEWQNVTNFEEMIKRVTGEDDQGVIQQVGERAMALYENEDNGYQRAVSIFKMVDSGATLAGVTSLAAKLAEDVSWLEFLGKVTPKPETSQGIDAALKFAAEVGTFLCTNGLPGDSVGDFVSALTTYEKEDLMRIAAWVSFDCVLPLGPEFLITVTNALETAMDKIEESSLYQRIAHVLPGGSTSEKRDFVKSTIDQSSGFITQFVDSKGVTQHGILESVKGYLEGAEGKLDYAAAILDVSTNTFEHTGIQTVARRVIKRAYGEL
ncbi:MAG: hypothetical protein HOO96_37145 [Polyangiaceae bacterium]|nr:hypothetical protein [Polyangiaceae bacterium]